jgi:hypothetical protein
MVINELACRSWWTANGGSGVEPGPVFFSEFFAVRNSGAAHAGAETDADKSAEVSGDSSSAASDQCN